MRMNVIGKMAGASEEAGVRRSGEFGGDIRGVPQKPDFPAGADGHGQPVSFTATLTATVATPDGSVTFYDGLNWLGTTNLAGGQATWSMLMEACPYFI
jgi:hypothetical protein